jgi:spore coat protein I
MQENTDRLAREVLRRYRIEPDWIRLVQGGGIKTVWQVTAGSRSLCLKRLRHTRDRALFSVGAQAYMAGKGAAVSPVLLLPGGDLMVEHEGYNYVLYQWFKGRGLNLSRKEDLARGVRGLAAFHRDSAGYNPPPGARVSSKLGRLGNYYASVTKRLLQWQEQALELGQNSLARAYLGEVEAALEMAGRAMTLLDQSIYSSWSDQFAGDAGLCHQDFGDGNALLVDNKLHILDLDGVTFDLPVRDLRKLLLKQMSSRGKWDEALLQDTLSWYSEIYPLNPSQIQVLLIDLFFPHELHDSAKNYFKKGKSIKAAEIHRAGGALRRKKEFLGNYLSLN